MHTYHVTYFYLATGMEDADTEDHGYVEAWTAEEAVEKVGLRISRSKKKYEREWGLSARKVRTDYSKVQDI